MFEFDELEKVEKERASEAAADTICDKTPAVLTHGYQVAATKHQPPQATLQQLALPDIWGLRFGGGDEAEEWQSPCSGVGQPFGDDTMALVQRELELEAEAERRRRPMAHMLKGLEGYKITIPIPWISKTSSGRHHGASTGADNQNEQENEPFVELLTDSFIKIYKLMQSAPESAWATIAGAWTISPHLAAIELLLMHVVPELFAPQAIGHCARIIVLMVRPEGSLHRLISVMLQERLPLSRARKIVPQIQSVLKDLGNEVIKLAACLLDPSPALLEAVSEAEGNVLTANGSMTREFATSLTKTWQTRINHFRSPRYITSHQADTIILRTNVKTITCLLYDLRTAFQAEDFQSRYKELRRTARMNGGAHAEMVHWTFMVQRSVLPRYGFPGTAAGVACMRKESGVHADDRGPNMSCCGDKVVAKLRRDIHMCLDMDVQKLDRLPLFHTVGDSHSTFGWPECVIQHWQGPLLCYNVDRVDLRKLDPPIREGDAVCFCFGEIDCRCHVHKHCTGEKSHEEVIDEIIDRYFNHLGSQIRLLPTGVKVFVYNVPPPVRRCDTVENAAFPCLGTDEQRQAYVLYFNKQLKEACQRSVFRFFDVYDQYVDDDGFLSKEYSDGNVHISDGMWIKEVIQQLQLKPFRPSQINFRG